MKGRQVQKWVTALVLLWVLNCTCIWQADAQNLTADKGKEIQEGQGIDQLTFFHQVTVEGKRLSLLDLCDQAGLSADWKKLLSQTDLGPAPRIGKGKEIYSHQVRELLDRLFREHGIAGEKVKVHLPERISVVRAVSQLQPEEVERLFRDFIYNKTTWNHEDISIQQIQYPTLPALPTGEVEHQINTSPQEDFLGDVTLSIKFLVAGEEAATLRVSGEVKLYRDVVHTRRQLDRNEVVGEEDIVMQRVDVTDHPERFVTDPSQVVGKRVLSRLKAGQKVSLRDIDQPIAIKRGEEVTIIYEEDLIRLTARGEAREDGSIGEKIRVKNIDTNKILSCRVLGSQMVQIVP